jgi:hypothetical protein
MSDHGPTRIYFELAEIPESREHPDFNRLAQRRQTFLGQLRQAGVSSFGSFPFPLIGMPARWAEIPYGDPLEPVMRIFCAGIKEGEYLEFIDPRPVKRHAFDNSPAITITYTKANIADYK